MKALRRKDAPWFWLFAIGGTIALSAAIGDGAGQLCHSPGLTL